MKSKTHIFTFEIESDSQRDDIEAALGKLSTELDLSHPLRLKGGHRGLITVPDTEPDATWAAMNRVVPSWRQMFLPPSR
jgi:hypothetical protein